MAALLRAEEPVRGVVAEQQRLPSRNDNWAYQLLSSYRCFCLPVLLHLHDKRTSSKQLALHLRAGHGHQLQCKHVVVSGSVEFGLVPAGGTATGLDCFHHPPGPAVCV